MGIIGVYVLITFVIAGVIAMATNRNGTRSIGRQVVVLVVSWILLAGAGILLVFVAGAWLLSSIGGGCINC